MFDLDDLAIGALAVLVITVCLCLATLAVYGTLEVIS